MERATIELTLPKSGAKVTLYEYLTTGDYRKIRKLMMSAMKVSMDQSKPEISDISAGVMSDVEDEALKCLICKAVTADGTPVNDLVAFVYDLPKEDGDLLYQRANVIKDLSDMTDDQKKN